MVEKFSKSDLDFLDFHEDITIAELINGGIKKIIWNISFLLKINQEYFFEY